MADCFSLSRHDRKGRSRYARKLDDAYERAVRSRSRLGPETLSLHGMSGLKYRHLINNLVRSVSDARYLEIGCWAGSTACSAMEGNRLKTTCIDDWSEFGGPKDIFHSNISRVITKKTDFDFIENDFRKMDFENIGKYNIYLFDGPHEAEHQYDALALVSPALDDEFVFVVDDWNFDRVRQGTTDAIKSCQLEILSAIEIRTTQDGTHAEVMCEKSDWHNGYFLGVLRKHEAPRRWFPF